MRIIKLFGGLLLIAFSAISFAKAPVLKGSQETPCSISQITCNSLLPAGYDPSPVCFDSNHNQLNWTPTSYGPTWTQNGNNYIAGGTYNQIQGTDNCPCAYQKSYQGGEASILFCDSKK